MLIAFAFAFAFLFALACYQVGAHDRLKRLGSALDNAGIAISVARAELAELRKDIARTHVELSQRIDRLHVIADGIEGRRESDGVRHHESLGRIASEVRGRLDKVDARTGEAHDRCHNLKGDVEVLRGRLDVVAGDQRATRRALRALLKGYHSGLNDQAIAISRARTEAAARLAGLDDGPTADQVREKLEYPGAGLVLGKTLDQGCTGK